MDVEERVMESAKGRWSRAVCLQVDPPVRKSQRRTKLMAEIGKDKDKDKDVILGVYAISLTKLVQNMCNIYITKI